MARFTQCAAGGRGMGWSRDVRRWLAYRDGEPYLHGGLERIWRKVQSESAPPLGRAHWQ